MQLTQARTEYCSVVYLNATLVTGGVAEEDRRDLRTIKHISAKVGQALITEEATHSLTTRVW